MVNAATGVVTISCPASPVVGQTYNVKKIDSSAFAVTLSGNGKNIDGAASVTLSSQYDNTTVQYDGNQWWQI